MSAQTLQVHIRGEEATELVGALLGELLRTPIVLTLEGALGAGKTTFTRGLVDGIQPGEGDYVSSPTYAVCNIYDTDPPVFHYDLYRLESEDDLESVGFYDSLTQGILIIEWPQKVTSVRQRADLALSMMVHDADSRMLHAEAVTPQTQHLLYQWRDALNAAVSDDLTLCDATL